MHILNSQPGPGDPPEGGEMNEMTLPSRQDSKFEPVRSEAESQRPNTILSFFRSEWGRIFLFLSNCRDREPNPKLWHERQLG